MSNELRRDVRPRILYLHGTVVPPSKDPARDPFQWLSQRLEGDVLQRVWWSAPASVTKVFGEGSYPTAQLGSFRFHWLLDKKQFAPLAWLRLIWFFLSTGRRLHKERPFDCIVTYSHMATGLCGAILKFLLGIPLVVQIATSPAHLGVASHRSSKLRQMFTQQWSNLFLHIAVGAADCTQILAPGLLDSFPLLTRRRTKVFHDFASLGKVPSGDPAASRTILLVGAPWYLKGADILTKAFLNLTDDYPDVDLKLLGHFTDIGPDEALLQHPRIAVLAARPNPEVLDLISKAAVFVLASRCEGMGRVLLEAMAAGVPVVGSEVGGIPYIIRDGENGFVFPVGDVKALEQCLRRLLDDPDLRVQMGQVGKRRVAEDFVESRYVDHFAELIEETIRGSH